MSIRCLAHCTEGTKVPSILRNGLLPGGRVVPSIDIRTRNRRDRLHVMMTAAHPAVCGSMPGVRGTKKGENAPYAVYLDVAWLASSEGQKAVRLFTSANGAICTPEVVPARAIRAVVRNEDKSTIFASGLKGAIISDRHWVRR